MAESVRFTIDELQEAWPALSVEERIDGFRLLPRADAELYLSQLPTREQFEILVALPTAEGRSLLRALALDDIADMLQVADGQAARETILAMLDEAARKEVAALLAYAEDAAGGLMNPRYAVLRMDMTVDEALSYLRRQTRAAVEQIYYAYVLDGGQRLVGVVSFRDLVTATADRRVRDVMRRDPISVLDEMDQEQVSQIFAQHNFLALPVVDSLGRMKGIVTADDIVDVVKEEATEDMQKVGGAGALSAPYLESTLHEVVASRVGWLVVLFAGQTLTATVMGYFEDELRTAVVLGLFIPLIISSGGNSGSQTSTLMVRALALGEVRLRDWWLVLRRELLAGAALGLILGVLGFVRVALWGSLFPGVYGAQFMLIGLTVAVSLVGVVLWGTITGSMLPILLRRLSFDPASASTPFVATLVDVTGLLVYFGVASVILRGVLL